MFERRIKYIYWFAYYNLDSPSVRYRAKYPLDYAKKKSGIKSTLIIPGYSPTHIFKFIKAYLSALFFQKKDSLIVIQRVQSRFIYARLLKILTTVIKRNTVYDLDDADYLIQDSETLHHFAKNCEFISAGSKEIADYLSSYNKNVYHITSPVIDLGIVKKKKNKILTIGWIGGFDWGHKPSLFHYLFPAIRALQFPCKLVLIGVTKSNDRIEIREYFKNCKCLQLDMPQNIDWHDELALQNRIVSFDVGIATLLNNPYQIAKSGIKAKQYMNNGVPVLSNNLPENNYVVVDGVNGHLCDTPKEFTDKLIHYHYMTDQEYNTYSRNARMSMVNFNHAGYFQEFERMINGRNQPYKSNDHKLFLKESVEVVN